MTRARRKREQLGDGRLLHWLGHRELEVATKVRHGTVPHGVGAVHVDGVVQVHFEGLEELLNLVVRGEVQPVPVDDGSAAQDEAHGFQVRQGKPIDGLPLGQALTALVHGTMGHGCVLTLADGGGVALGGILGLGRGPRSAGPPKGQGPREHPHGHHQHQEIAPHGAITSPEEQGMDNREPEQQRFRHVIRADTSGPGPTP